MVEKKPVAQLQLCRNARLFGVCPFVTRKKVTISSLPVVPLLSDKPRFAFLLTRNTFSASVPTKTLATNHARSLCSLSRSFCMCILHSSGQASRSLTDLSTPLRPNRFPLLPARPSRIACTIYNQQARVTGLRRSTAVRFQSTKVSLSLFVHPRRYSRSSLPSPLCLSPPTWKFTHGS